VNPGPDFKQTGNRLRTVILQLWEQVLQLVLDKNPNDPENPVPGCMNLVYRKEWSASKLQGGMNLSD